MARRSVVSFTTASDRLRLTRDDVRVTHSFGTFADAEILPPERISVPDALPCLLQRQTPL